MPLPMRFGSSVPRLLTTLFALTLVAPVQAQSVDIAGFTASDNDYEDHVRLAWTGTLSPGFTVHITRRDTRTTDPADLVAIQSRLETQYLDYTAVPHTYYEYCAIAVDPSGSENPAQCDEGHRNLRRPNLFTASDGLFEEHVFLKWRERSNLEVSVVIIRDREDIAVLPPNSTTYVDKTAVPGTRYEYTVAVVDADGNRSGTPQEGNPEDVGWRGYIYPPADVAASDGEYTAHALVTWTDVPTREEGYRVYRYPGTDTTGVTPELVGSVASDVTEFRDTDAASATPYTWCVASVLAPHESVYVCDSGMKAGLPAPDNLTASLDTHDDRVVLTWRDVPRGASGYQVTRTYVGETIGTVIDSVRAGVGRLYDFQAQPARTANYCLRSYSEVDPTALSPATCSDGRRAAVLKPVSVVASDGDIEDRVAIQWTSTSTSVMLFKVFRATRADLTDKVLIDAVPSSARYFEDVAIESDVDYHYAVSAVTVIEIASEVASKMAASIEAFHQKAGAEGFKRASQAQSLSAHLSQMAAEQMGTIHESELVSDAGRRSLNPPSSITATLDEFEDHVQIDWVDASNLESGYLVFRVFEGAREQIARTGSSRATFGDYSGRPGRTYTYEVQAFDEYGTSQAVTAQGRRVLKTPADLMASDGTSETQVDLLWTDLSRFEEAYRVYRTAGGVREPVGDMLPRNTNRAVDANPVIGQEYVYEVVAVDSLDTDGDGIKDAIVESLAASDEGSTGLLAPASLRGSTQYPDRVVLAWSDVSSRNESYRVTRNGVALAPGLAADAIRYVDSSPSGRADYCVVSVAGDSEKSACVQAGPAQARSAVSVEALELDTEVTAVSGNGLGAQVALAGDYAMVNRGSAFGKAALFGDFDPSYLLISGPEQALDLSEVTIEFWLKLNSVDDQEAFHVQVARRRGIGLFASLEGFTLSVDSRIVTFKQEGGGSPTRSRTVQLDSGWHHFAFSWNGTALNTYVDGVLSGSNLSRTVAAQVSIAEGETMIQVGGRRDPITQQIRNTFAGQLDEFRVWSEIRTADQVRESMEGPRPPAPEANLLLSYDFDDWADTGTGEPGVNDIRDYSGLGLHADATRLVGLTSSKDSGDADFLVLEDGDWSEDNASIADDANARVGDFDLSGRNMAIGVPYPEVSGDLHSSVTTYRYSNRGWTDREVINFGDEINQLTGHGSAVALGGETLFVGAPAAGLVSVLARTNGNWNPVEDIDLGQGYGAKLVASPGWLVVGSFHDAPLRIFRKEGASWIEQNWSLPTVLQPSDPRGAPATIGAWNRHDTFSLAIQDNTLIVGDPENGSGAGRVGVFQLGSSITLSHVLTGDGLRFGSSVAISESSLLVGAEGALVDEGVVYVYAYLAGGSWQLRGTIQAPTGDGTARYGAAVALDAGQALLGAPGAPATDGGRLFRLALLQGPASAAVSDGSYDNRTLVSWTGQATNHSGFKVYRRQDDGALQLLGDAGPAVRVFSDFETAAGTSGEYCVTAYSETLLAGESARADGSQLGETTPVCDSGWRPPDGRITGRVAGVGGGGTSDALMCLSPNPGQSLIFDGSGGSVAVAGSSTLDFGTDYTVEFWMRHRMTTGGASLASWSGGGSIPFQVSVPDDAWRLEAVARDGAGSIALMTPADLVLNDGQWHHIALVRDGATNEVSLRIDGQEAAAGAFTSGGSSADQGTLYLGALGGTSGWYSGELDEMRIWNYARNTSQLEAAQRSILRGNESGLVALWSMDEGAGRVSADLTGSGFNGSLAGGVHWGDASPISTCDLTDTDGNYGFTDIRYGDGETLRLSAERAGRTFDPATRQVALSPESPVQNGVDFVDTSVFAVNGIVEYVTDHGVCPSPDISILVDGRSGGTTEADGSFSVSAQPSNPASPNGDPRTIIPQREGHTFSPARFRDVISADLDGLRFADETRHTLKGLFGPSCAAPGNIGTAKVRIWTENGCFDQTVDVAGAFELDLPPQEYLIQVVSVEPANPLYAVDMTRFFDDLGVLSLDLTGTDEVEVDLRYHAPVVLAISGFPDPAICPADQIIVREGDQIVRRLPNVPVIEFGVDRVDLSVAVVENYGNGLTCPVDDASLRVFDSIGIAGGVPVDVEVKDGEALYSIESIMSTPPNVLQGAVVDGVDRSFQKSITFVASTPGRDDVTETEWVIQEGDRPRSGSFVSASTDPIPLLVLHDPPGSGSYSYVEEGTQICKTVSKTYMFGGSGKVLADIALGYKASVGGIGWLSENGFGTFITSELVSGRENGSLDDPERNIQICFTANTRLETPGDETWVGEDVFAGVSLNLLFQESDQVQVAECSIPLDDLITVQLDSDNAFRSTFMYGSTHLTQSLIPDLIRLADAPGAQFTDPEGQSPPMGFIDAAAGWERLISLESQLTEYGVAGRCATMTPSGELERAPCAGQRTFAPENISYSAGPAYEVSRQADTTRTTFLESTRIHIGLEGSSGWLATINGHDQKVGLGFSATQEWVEDEDSTRASTRNVGYVLSDGDTGDFFSVDVGTDPIYGTPVFQTVSGRSSNPWEPDTQRRDVPVLTIDPPILTGVPADEPAVFQLQVGNDSDSRERREYVLAAPGNHNRDNAGLTVTGDLLGGDRTERFYVDAGTSQTVSLAVTRGPTKYRYDSLAVVLYPEKEYAIWQSDVRQPFALADTAYFSVHFAAPCSEIAIQRPLEYWRLNHQTIVDGLEVQLFGFNLDISESDALQSIGLQYREQGTSTWQPAVRAEVAALTFLDESNPDWATVWGIPAGVKDGQYEVRAFTECSSAARVYSDPIPGSIDTSLPDVFGYPEPADQVLSLGDAIRITFDEELACDSGKVEGAAQNVFIEAADGSPISLDLDCDGRTLILVPRASLAPFEGDVLTARLTGATPAGNGLFACSSCLQDMAGNPVSNPGGGDIQWSFAVRQSAFSFSPINVALDITRGRGAVIETGIVNGRGLPVDVDLPGTLKLVHDTDGQVEVAPSVAQARIVSGGRQPVSFALPDNLALGTWSGTFQASGTENGVDLGRVQFHVSASVACRAPIDWDVDPHRYQHSMSLVAQVYMNGIASTDASDRIAALVDGEVRGHAYVSEVSPGVYRAAMLVYSELERGDVVAFQVWDDDQCVLYEDVSPSILFSANESVGTVGQPITVEAPPAASAQAVSFAAGWTWFSVNTEATETAINKVLSGVAAGEGDVVKSQTAFATYDPSQGWVGTLTDLVPGLAYLAKLSQSNNAILSGSAADPSVPLTLSAGWNWLGFPRQTGLSLNPPSGEPAALSLLSPAASSGDLIKSQFAFAEFVDGLGWLGTLASMEPGLGYLLRVARSGTVSFPANSVAASKLASRLASKAGHVPAKAGDETIPDVVGRANVLDGPGRSPAASTSGSTNSRWTLDPHHYSANMTAVLQLQVAGLILGEGPHEVAVLAGDQVRAVGRIQHVEAIGKDLAFLVIYGEPGESGDLVIAVYDPRTGAELHGLASLKFEANTSIGSVLQPLEVQLNAVATSVEGDTLPTEFALRDAYPNPFNPVTTLSYDVPNPERVVIELFDVVGRRVTTLLNQDMAPGRHQVRVDAHEWASGVYFYRMRAGSFSEIRQMVLLK